MFPAILWVVSGPVCRPLVLPAGVAGAIAQAARRARLERCRPRPPGRPARSTARRHAGASTPASPARRPAGGRERLVARGRQRPHRRCCRSRRGGRLVDGRARRRRRRRALRDHLAAARSGRAHAARRPRRHGTGTASTASERADGDAAGDAVGLQAGARNLVRAGLLRQSHRLRREADTLDRRPRRPHAAVRHRRDAALQRPDTDAAGDRSRPLRQQRDARPDPRRARRSSA